MKQPYFFIRRPTQKGDVWYCVFDYLPNNPKSTRILVLQDPDQREAIRWAERNYEGQLESRKIPTFREYTEKFFTEECAWRKRIEGHGHSFNAGYYSQHRSRLTKYMWQVLGKYLISGITKKVIDDYLIGLRDRRTGDPLNHETKWKHLVALRKIFNQAEYDEFILPERNPTSNIEGFKGESVRPGVFMIDELKQLFPRDREILNEIWLSQMWICYFMLAAVCGTRPGETSGIYWQGWHRALGMVMIKKALKTGGNQIAGIKTEKKGAKRIPKPITDRLTQELLLYESECQDTTGLMFSIEEKPIASSTACKHFKGALKRAGIERAGRTPYSFRHSYETHILENMFDHEAQVVMGHRNEITKRYDQRSDEAFLKFASKFKEKIEAVRPL